MKFLVFPFLAVATALAAGRLHAQIPVITHQPVDGAVWAGANTMFTVGVSNAGAYTYQWQLNGTNLPSGIIFTVAGGGVGDGLPATSDGFYYVPSVAIDAGGNLLIVDFNDSRIRKVDTNGIVTTFAGNASAGFSGDGGPATNASLCFPSGVAVDAAGNVFIADSGNLRIRKVDVLGTITTVAGGGNPSRLGTARGDGGPATNASFSLPYAVAADVGNNLFIADYGANLVRKVSASGLITTLAGNGFHGYYGDGLPGSNAVLNAPEGVAVNAAGEVFIADTSNHRIRKVGTNGIISTFAGNGTNNYSGDGQAATNACLGSPNGVIVDGGGNVLIADTDNNRIRKVTAAGIISTVAGNGQSGTPTFAGDGGLATNASLNQPRAVATDAHGGMWIADAGNFRIRRVNPLGVIDTVAGNGKPLYPSNAGNFAGDGGPAANAAFDDPVSVAVDSQGELFIADYDNFRLRKVDASSRITSVAGGGTNSPGDGMPATNDQLNSLSCVVAVPGGNLLLAANNLLYQLDTNGLLTTVAGGGTNDPADGGPATNVFLGSVNDCKRDASGNLFIITGSVVLKLGTNGNIAMVAGGGIGDHGPAVGAALVQPDAVVADPAGDLFIADTGRNLVRKVGADGTITTIAGNPRLSNNGLGQYSGDGGPATNAGLSMPTGIAIDQSGNLFIVDQYNLRIRKVDGNGVITTVAGNGYNVFSGDGLAATNSSLNYPQGIAADPMGNLFIADSGNNRIRKVQTNGVITTVAGGGPSLGDGGPATAAALNIPTSVALDTYGNLYIADENNERVRKVDTNGVITTVAGNGGQSYRGDGGPATNASFLEPSGVVVDAAGNLFIADREQSVVREVNTNGIITTVAGTGAQSWSGDGGPATNATLHVPNGVALSPAGGLLIADTWNNRIRQVGPGGTIETVAGNGSYYFAGDGGSAAAAAFCYPGGLALDGLGNVYIADTLNNRIRKLDTNGIVTSIAGISPGYPGVGGMSGSYSGDGGPATNAALYYPEGMTFDGSGNLFFADTVNNRIRVISSQGIITTVAGTGTNAYGGDGGPAIFAKLGSPSDVILDEGGNLFIVDRGNNRIRKVSNAQSPSLFLNGASAAAGGSYQVIVTGAGGSVTSSPARLIVATTPVIYGIDRQDDGSVRLDFVTPPGSTNKVLCTTNLSPPVVWQSLSTNLAGPNGTWQFTDTNANIDQKRFYHTRMP